MATLEEINKVRAAAGAAPLTAPYKPPTPVVQAPSFAEKYGWTAPSTDNVVTKVGNVIAGNQTPDTGALFSTTKEQAKSAIPTAAKTVANVVPDFLRTTAGLPVQTAGLVGKVGTEAAALVKESGGVLPAAKNVFVNATPESIGSAYLTGGTPGVITHLLGSMDPKVYIDALKALIPSAAQKVVKGDFFGAAQDISNHPFQQISPFLLTLEQGAKGFDITTGGGKVPTGAPEGTPPKFSATKTLDTGMTAVTEPVINATKAVATPIVKGASSLAGTLAKFGTAQSTGLSPDTITRIISNPEDFSPSAMKELSREGVGKQAIDAINTRLTDLAGTGKEYGPIREAGTPVTIPKGTVEGVLGKYKIGVDKAGQLTFDKESIPTTPGDRTALQNWYDTYGKDTGHTSNSFLNARQSLDLLAKWDDTKSTASRTLGKDLYRTLNETSRQQVPGLSELDARFAPEVKALEQVKKDYFKADGTLKDNAISKIANLTNQGRKPILDRLEAISPGIGDKIRTLKAVEDIHAASGQKVGTYARAGLGVFGAATLNVPAIVAAVLSEPHIATQILRGYGKLLGLKETAMKSIVSSYEKGAPTGASLIDKTRNFVNDHVGLSIKDVSGGKPSVPKGEAPAGAGIPSEVSQSLKQAKGLSADDIMAKHPDIQLKKDVSAKDIYGNKITIPEGEALTPYELKGNKVLLQDGETYIVTKNQYQNIKGNAVSGEAKPFAPELAQTQETVKGGSKWQGDNLMDNGKTVANVIKNEDGTWSYQSDNSEGSDTFKTRKEAMDYAEADATGLYSGNETKYSSYQLPGGENYKEILIKTPVSKESATMADDLKIVEQRRMSGEISNEEAGDLYKKIRKIYHDREASKEFKSSHWDDPNVLSHLRLNERTYQGKPVTFMEELQSDWMRTLRNEAKEKTMENGIPNKEKAAQYLRDAFAGKIKTDTPINQMLKEWETPSIKRALQEAVNNGSEYFAWINGDQTSARYNLATQIDNVAWKENRIRIKTQKGDMLTVPYDEKGIIQGKDASMPGAWAGKPLGEALGKGLAEKIMADPSGKLSGEGLKFGGEWANNLYDKQVKDIVGKLTGAKVETLDMRLPVDGKTTDWIRTQNGKRIGTTMENSVLTEGTIKVGQEIAQDSSHPYIITDVLGDGKFKAVRKDYIQNIQTTRNDTPFSIGNDNFFLDRNHEQTFDISTKKSVQQGIKLTPEVKAVIKGESPVLKKPSGKNPVAPPDRIQGLDLSKFKQYSEPLIRKIADQLLGDKSKAVVIDADTIKKFHPNFDPDHPELLHEESSALTKFLVNKAIDEDTSGKFIALGGGPGSGKSEILLDTLKKTPSVIFDGTLGGLDSASKKIDYALSKGKSVELHPLYAPVELATLFNQMRSRHVATDILTSAHFDFRSTMPELLAKYGKKIEIKPAENAVFGEKGGPAKFTNLKNYLDEKKMPRSTVDAKSQKILDYIKKHGLEITKQDMPLLMKTAP